MSNKQINSKTKNSSINNNLLYESSQIIQKFDKINIKETEPIINDYNLEGDLSIVIDELVYLIFMELNKGKDAIIINQHVFNYINNHKIILQEIYSWISNNQNDSNSIFLFGYFNYHGIGTNSDKQKAIELYNKAAVLENNVAQLNLINIYNYEKNYYLAFKLSKKLAEKEIPYAIYNLGNYYYCGSGTFTDKNKGFKLYQKAADLGNSNGMIKLGRCYYSNIHKPKTFELYKKAAELYEKAADLENSSGIIELGYCYENGIGTDMNKQKAFELYKKAADLENLNGIWRLGHCYENGIGTDINKQRAFELFQKAAELGDNSAQYKIAKMYEKGITVKKDMNKAIYWYQKSAEQKYIGAQNKLKKLLKK